MFQGNTRKDCVPSNQIYRLGELKEGWIYNLEFFIVAAARNEYKIIYHPSRIKIAQLTKVTQAVPEPEDFPMFTCNAKSLDVLRSHTWDNIVLSGFQWIQACTFHTNFSAFYVHLILSFFLPISDVAWLVIIVSGYHSVKDESTAKEACSLKRC